MKLTADVIREMPPRRVAGRGSTTSRAETPEERVAQIDPPTAELMARAPRQRRWRGSVAAPALRVHGPPGIAGLQPAADPALRGSLSTFSGAGAEVHHHPNAGGRRRVSDPSPMGLSATLKAGKPAYPRYNRGAGEGRCPFDPQQTRAPTDCAGGGVAPLPPVTALRDG